MPVFFAAVPSTSSLDAYHAKGVPLGAKVGAANNAVKAGALWGRVYNCNASGTVGQANISWPGNYNFPSGNNRSVLLRFRTNYTGAPGTAVGLFNIKGPGIYPCWYTIGVTHGTSGQLQIYIWGDNGVGEEAANIAAFSPTADTPYDLVFTWDSTNAANAQKFYINGSLLGQRATNRVWTNLPTDGLGNIGTLGIGGCGVFVLNSNIQVEEFAIFDEILSPATISSTYTGASRTTPLAVSPLTGISFPPIAKVKSDTSWNEYGTTRTGTRTDPTASQVKSGVQYGAGGNEFTGNVTLPTANKVETGQQYGANGTEFTGTLETGASDPGVDNVLAGVDYEIAGVPLTGTYEPVTEAQVQDGVEFGPNGSLTGSFGRHIPQTNQYFAPLEVQAEIFAVLNADASLTTLLGANKVFDFVPDKKAFPYVTINALPFVQRDNATNDGMECEFQINVWYSPGASGQTSRGNKPVQLIQKRIDELLQHRSLCVNGWNTLQLRRTFIDILVESDNVTRQGIQRFKLFLGSKD